MKKLCYGCGKEIEGTYFEHYNGEDLCEECGEDLYIHDFTESDEYPYIDGEGDWDGGMYEGEMYRKVTNHGLPTLKAVKELGELK